MSLYQDYTLEQLISKVAEYPDEIDLHIELIKRYVTEGQVQSALDQAIATNQLMPGDLSVQALHAYCLVNLGRGSEGAPLLEALVRKNATCEFQDLIINEISPLFIKDMGSLTQEEYIQQKIDNAPDGEKEIFQRAQASVPIHTALLNNELDLAITLLQEYLVTFPSDVNGKMSLAGIYQTLGENEKAATLYRQVIASDPASASAYFGLALVLPNLEEQILASQLGLEIVPSNHGERYNLGVRLLHDGQNEFARNEWLRIPGDNALYAYALSGIGESFELEGDWAQAIEYQTKAVTLCRNDPEMHLKLGCMKIDAGFLYEGLEALDRASELESESADVQMAIAEKYDAIGQTEEAIKLLEEVIDVFPEDFRLGLRLGLYHYRLEQFEETIRYSLLSIEANCEQYASYWNTAVSFARLGKRDDCLRFLKDAVERNPESAQNIMSDDDLEPYWDDAEFEALVNTNA